MLSLFTSINGISAAFPRRVVPLTPMIIFLTAAWLCHPVLQQSVVTLTDCRSQSLGTPSQPDVEHHSFVYKNWKKKFV